MTELTRDHWLKHYGFEKDPFSPESVRAEADILLESDEAFVEFPYYDVIKGQVGNPGPRFVFAGRGGGKTALRIRLQKTFDSNLKTGKKEPILAVTYNHFDRVLKKSEHNPSKVVPQHHIDEIVGLIVKGLFKALIINKAIFNNEVLEEERTKQLLNWYLTEFKVFQPWDIDRLLWEVSGLGYFFSEKKLSQLVKGGVKMASLVLPEIGQRAVETLTNFFSVDEPLSISKENVPIVELLEELVKLSLRLGFKAVYILVDDIDEPQYYGEQLDYQPAFDLIRTLASAPKLIGIPGLIFKFFLPMEIRERCLQTFRLDKFSEQVIKWTYYDLDIIRERRMRTCKDERPYDLQALCNQDLAEHIDQWIVDFAKEIGNPRALIYVGNAMLVEHFRQNRETEDIITRATWERARQRAEEVLR